MVNDKKALQSVERRHQVRKTLEFLKYDGQIVIEPQWYSWTQEEESE